MTDSLWLVVETLLWGPTAEPIRHVVRFVAGYAAFFVVAFAVATLLGLLGWSEGVSFIMDSVVPAAIFGLPVGVGALNGVLGGGLIAGVAVGVTPAFSFGATIGLGWSFTYLRTGSRPAPGESSVWGLTLVFAGVGLAGSLVGTGLGMVFRFALATV
jgi:hypothetical protein